MHETLAQLQHAMLKLPKPLPMVVDGMLPSLVHHYAFIITISTLARQASMSINASS